jgi:RNA polymerase sigma factor (sigma-70 family)
VKIKPEDHLGLAYSVASLFVKGKERVKDSIEFSIACEALVLASNFYRPDQGAFTSIAYRVIFNKLIDNKKKEKRKKRIAKYQHLDENQWLNLEEEKSSCDLIKWLDEIHWNEEEKSDLKVFIEVELQNQPITKIASDLKIARPTVYSKLRRIKDKIRNKYAA